MREIKSTFVLSVSLSVISSKCEGLGSETGPVYGNFEKYQSKWRTSMIEVRSATKKEAKISGTEIKNACALTLSLSTL